MANIEDQIREIEEEIRKTKYNKATEHHIGLLKAKLARLKEAKESTKRGGGQAGVKKTGNAMVSLVGFPSVGKSTLFNKLTNAKSEVGDYDFTTVNIIPGMMVYRGAKIQILDLPGLIEGAATGKGRGKGVLSVVRNSDLIIIVTDINFPDPEPLIKILHDAGIRLNRRRPRIFLVKKDRGGINIQKTVNIDLDEDIISSIMREFKIVNADLIIRDKIDIDDLIDFLSGNRVYIPGIFVLNKIDQGIEKNVLNIAEKYSMVKVSAINGEGLDSLKDAIFDALDFITVYLKPPNGKLEQMVVKRYSNIEMICRAIHKDFIKNFRYAVINGPSAKYPNQKVGLEHVVEEGDTITIYLKK